MILLMSFGQNFFNLDYVIQKPPLLWLFTRKFTLDFPVKEACTPYDHSFFNFILIYRLIVALFSLQILGHRTNISIYPLCIHLLNWINMFMEITWYLMSYAWAIWIGVFCYQTGSCSRQEPSDSCFSITEVDGYFLLNIISQLATVVIHATTTQLSCHVQNCSNQFNKFGIQ